jgi:hypothetical protein
LQYATLGSHKDTFLQASKRRQFSDPGKCRDLITEASEMNTHSASGPSLDLSPINGRFFMAFNFMKQQLSMPSDQVIASHCFSFIRDIVG